MKNLKLTTIAFVMAGTALSADGFYISGKIGAQTQFHEIERDTGAALGEPDQSFVTRTGETDAGGGIALGYESGIGSGPLYWGAEAFYNAESAQTRNINGILVTDVQLEATYGARAILGAQVSDVVKLYTHAGVTQVDFDVTNSYTFAPPVTEDSYSETGFSYGVGASVAVADNWSVFSEYTEVVGVEFDGIPEIAGGTNRVNDNTLDLSSLSVGVKYSF
ncbi:outer membrane beta-barrel protein [Yoonia sp. BS5-3]|uniref:Outer membrane protein n=1 Tax=Yoonia phaeophyticola TaxID=3137369 RepID=A0ABZ2V5A9_9RHOB